MNDRKEYYKKYFRKKNNFPEPKIKDIGNYLADIKKYPSNFPEEEFGKKLDEIIIGKTPITEKKLKDMLMWDILDKKGILTPERMLRIYYGSNWGKAIQEFMQAKEYFGELVGNDIIYKFRTE